MEIIKGLELQFEYKIMTYYGLMEEAVTQDIIKKKNTSSEDVLNELGKDGWELFTILQGKGNCLFIFKRSKWVEKKAQEKQEDNANKIERKFKVGDWIVNQHGTVRHIEEVDNAGYQTDKGWLTHDCYEKDFRLWDVADANDGDILVDGLGNICIYQESSTKLMYHSYCYGNHKCFIDGGGSHEIEGTYPATKEQHELLFKKMHEAGYMWDSESKQLLSLKAEPSGEQKPTEWSEEDENNLTDTCVAIRKFYHNTNGAQELIDWLQSLKRRVKGD